MRGDGGRGLMGRRGGSRVIDFGIHRPCCLIAPHSLSSKDLAQHKLTNTLVIAIIIVIII